MTRPILRLFSPRACALVATCFFLLTCAAHSQQPASPATPTTPAKSAPASAAPAAPDYSQEPFVVDEFHTSMRFENDGTGEREQTVRIRVQSEAGVQQLGELVFSYNSENETIEIHYVRARKPDGSLVTASADAVKDMTAPVARDAPVYTDTREKHITVPGLRPGDTLEYDISTHLAKPLAPGEFWYSQNFIKDAIVFDERVDVNVPRDRALTIKSRAFSNIDGKENRVTALAIPPAGGPLPVTSDFSKEISGGREILHWTHRQLAHPSDDDAKKKSAKPEDTYPDIEFTTFKSWTAIAQWYASLAKGRTDPSPEIRAKVAELIQGQTTPLEKMEALYHYVATNIRYVSLSFGLARYQPHSAAEVFANQYGDCKDKATLLTAMLSAAGIPSDAVLIPYSRKLDADIPSPAQFDHVITAVPQGNQLLWMDSTAEVAPFRMLTAPLRDKSALLVPPDGAGKIVTTPADPPFLSVQHVDVTGQVSDLGKLTARVHYSLRGDNEYALRAAFRATPQTQWKQLGQTMAAFDGIRGEVTSVKPSDPTATKDPFEIDLDYSQPNFLDWSTKSVKIALPLLTIGLPQISDDNADPIKLGSPLDVTVSLKLTLPASDTAQPPVAIAVSRDYADFKSTYDFANHTVTAERTLNFKMRELPADRTSDYLAFSRAVESDETQILVVDNSTTGTPEIPSTAKASELLEAGSAALNSGNLRAAIPLLQRVVELEPKHKLAWNELGLAYLRLGRFSDASAAFQKQIDVNPYDEHAYNYLGFSRQQEQKYPEAIAAFRKQIELSPLDPIAHAALGALFLERHDYPSAVPELQKAVILSPDDAGLQISLGQALLATGEKDKALAAFEKGADLSQTPMIWNNVAYSLADNHLQLDRALQYAQSAVATTAANLRNADLAHLTLTDLGQVQSLGAYWDTLGWVYFQKGDLANAEKFVRAAWMLDLHGEVADHLAQILAKRGQKDQAIQTFALALVAPHTVPETHARLAALLDPNLKSNTQPGAKDSAAAANAPIPSPDDKRIADLVTAAAPRFASLRAISAGALVPEKSDADFFVMLSPEGPGAKVDAVQFISGSNSLRPFADRLRQLDFGSPFPDAMPTKLIRRGTLSCPGASSDGAPVPCVFRLALPEDVRTLN
ncbi:MAG: DUF3857 domain-containing protein [Candidatus Acidiferrales bacterium]